jgi:hypothetical protein
MHDDNELPTGPCPAEGASEHEWTDVIGGDQCPHCGAFFIDWAAIEIADLRAQVRALVAQRDAAQAGQEEH